MSKNDPNKPLKMEEHAPDGALAVKVNSATQKPSLYKVFLLNDDYTPMDFVIQIMQTIFNKNTQDAAEITMNIHQKGLGLCGVYTYDVAETKVMQTLELARRSEYPLQCTLEKE